MVRHEGWRVVAASSLGVFFVSLPFVTFSMLLRPVAEEHAWSRESMSVAFATMTLSAALSAPLVGVLFDRVGPRRICGLCLLLCGSAFASLALLTPRLSHLYGVFLLIGLAMPGTSVVVYSRVIASWFDDRRGTALAIVMASAALGGIVHPALAAALIRSVGWRGMCLALGALMVIVGAPVVARFVRERSVAMQPEKSPVASVSIRDALRSRVFWILITAVFGSTLALNGVIVHLSALLTDRGVSSAGAAMVVSTLGAASLMGRLLTGWLIDRFTATHVAIVLLWIAALGTVLLSAADSLMGGLVAAALIGFGTGGEFDVVPYLLSRYFGLRALSTLYGLHWTAWGIAGAVGPVVMGRAFDTTGSYTAVLLSFAAGTFGVAMLFRALPPYEHRRTHALTV